MLADANPARLRCLFCEYPSNRIRAGGDGIPQGPLLPPPGTFWGQRWGMAWGPRGTGYLPSQLATGSQWCRTQGEGATAPGTQGLGEPHFHLEAGRGHMQALLPWPGSCCATCTVLPFSWKGRGTSMMTRPASHVHPSHCGTGLYRSPQAPGIHAGSCSVLG